MSYTPPSDTSAAYGTLTTSVITGLVRQGLTAGGAYLVGAGLINDNDALALVGAAPVIVSIAWTIWQKVVARRRLRTAAVARSHTL